MTEREVLKLALEAFEWNYNTDLDNIPACEQWAKMLKENITAIRETLSQPEYNTTSYPCLMENAQGELERIKLVQTGVGIGKRAEEAYKAAKERGWVGVSEEIAQPEQGPVAYSYTSRITGAQGFSHHPMPRFIDSESWDIKPLYTQQYTYIAPTHQKPFGWKLVPIEPTNEMLKAMDECSTEGYDERLLAGHASSVYMAAVDVAPTPPQPEQSQVEETLRYEIDALEAKLAEYRAQPEQEPVASGEPLPCPFCGHTGLDFSDGSTYRWGHASCGGCGAKCGEVRREYPDKGEWHSEAIAEWNRRYTRPQAREPLSDEVIDYLWRVATTKPGLTLPMVRGFARAIEAAHGIKE